MVADFDSVLRRMRSFVDEELDHQLLLQENDPLVSALRTINEPFRALRFPPTAENIARLLFEHAESAGLPVVEVRLEDQPGSVASFRK